MYKRFVSILFSLLIGFFCACPFRPQQSQTVGKAVSFQQEVLPILIELAGNCHTPEDMAGNYALNSYEAVMAGGTDSIPNVIPGKPDSSLLYLYLLKGHPFGITPDSAKLRIIRDWILQGARNN
ncbi:MAG: c-type cytochrome domain-containing protein [bacterium]